MNSMIPLYMAVPPIVNVVAVVFSLVAIGSGDIATLLASWLVMLLGMYEMRQIEDCINEMK